MLDKPQPGADHTNRPDSPEYKRLRCLHCKRSFGQIRILAKTMDLQNVTRNSVHRSGLKNGKTGEKTFFQQEP